MKTLFTIFAALFSIHSSAQVYCSSLIESEDTTVCPGQQITITANGPLAGLGNGGECGYLPEWLEPLAWYPFCESLNDESGHDHDAQPLSGISVNYQFDRFGRWNSAVHTPLFVLDNAQVNFLDLYTSSFTMSVWVLLTWDPQEDQFIFRKGSASSPSDFALMLKYDSIQEIYYPHFYARGPHQSPGGIIDTVLWETAPNSVNIYDSAWHMITVVRSGPEIILYVDGGLISSEQFAGANGIDLHNDVSAFIGASGFFTFDNIFEGTFDDLTFFDGAFDSLQINDLYSITAIDYNWSTGDSGNQIVITPVSDTMLIVSADNGTDICTDTFNIYISGNSLLQADTIYGTSVSCIPPKGGKAVFSTDSIPGAVYHWTVPAGLIIESGQGTPVLNVKWRTATAYYGIVGNICVAIENFCGTGEPYCKPVDMQITAPGTPPYIFAQHIYKMCPGDTSSFYIAPVTRASSYEWSMPAGLYIVEGGDSDFVTITADSLFTGGDISVRAKNVCGISQYRTKSILFNTPIKPVISGPTEDFCHHQSGNGLVSFSVSNAGAFAQNTLFYWSGDLDVQIPGDNEPSPVIGAYWWAGTGHVTVVAHNTCGVSVPAVRGWNTRPPLPGPINGPLLVCPGDTVTYIANDSHLQDLNSYYPQGEGVWSFYANGAEIPGVIVIDSSFEDRITIIWPVNTPANASVRVREINDCDEAGPWRVLNGIQVDSSNCGLRLAEVDNEPAVYPNPATDVIFVRLHANSDGNSMVDVIEMSGRTVIRNVINTQQGYNTFEVNCRTLQPGNYILQIINSGGTVSYHRFSKQQ